MIALATFKRVPLLKVTLFIVAQMKPLVKLIHAACCFQGYAEFCEFLREVLQIEGLVELLQIS